MISSTISSYMYNDNEELFYSILVPFARILNFDNIHKAEGI